MKFVIDRDEEHYKVFDLQTGLTEDLLKSEISERTDIEGVSDGEVTVYTSIEEFMQSQAVVWDMLFGIPVPYHINDTVVGIFPQVVLDLQGNDLCDFLAAVVRQNNGTFTLPPSISECLVSSFAGYANAVKGTSLARWDTPETVCDFLAFTAADKTYDDAVRIKLSEISDNLEFLRCSIVGACDEFACDYNALKELHLHFVERSEWGNCFVGKEAFENCRKLVSVTLTGHLVKIGSFAFGGCRALQHLALPDSVQIIERCAFIDTAITEFTAPTALAEIGDNTFGLCEHLLTADFSGCADLHVLPDGCFGMCKSLAHVELPSGLQQIKLGCFNDCESLKEVYLPDNLQVLEDGAFHPGTCLYIRKGSHTEELYRSNADSMFANYEVVVYDKLSA